MPQSPHSFLDTDVREVFENNSIQEIQGIQRKINYEIERKREELRMLVGERYRDLIDAADTIGTMKTSSANVFQKLSALRTKLIGLPNQLTLSTYQKSEEHPEADKRKLTRAELEVVTELKLALDIPRQIQYHLENEELIPALHLGLLFIRKLVCSEEKYTWSFLQATGNDLGPTALVIQKNIQEYCETGLNSSKASYQKLSECIVVKQILTETPSETILSNWLTQKILACKNALVSSEESDFLCIVASTIQAVHKIFIDPELYSTTTKVVRKFKIEPLTFVLRFTPKVISEYNSKPVLVEEPPRITRLAQIVRYDFITPLMQLLDKQENYLSDLISLIQLNEYRHSSNKILKEYCEDLTRIVLGPSTNIWTHVFYPVFQRRAESVVRKAVAEIMDFIRTIGFPKFQTADVTFDLVGFIWKPSAITSEGASPIDNLKVKCLTPNVSQLCEDMEFRLSELLVDFQTLGDVTLKEFISGELSKEIEKFVLEVIQTIIGTTESSNSSFSRFATGLIELCPTLWKLLEKDDTTNLKRILMTQTENCWQNWIEFLLQSFNSKLEQQMGALTPENVVVFMPMGEIYETDGGEHGEKFVPSVRIPVELTHTLHSLLFAICIELSKVGPQSIPRNVKDNLRVSLAKSIIQFYEKVTDIKEGEVLTPQMALQFIFDLKFIQWFHASLSGSADEIIQKLKSIIDPFDWDIVNPRVTMNLKRFLFENQLTMGLLFSDESHGFIAQNFKTKQSLSFPTPTRHILYNQLQLLPL